MGNTITAWTHKCIDLTERVVSKLFARTKVVSGPVWSDFFMSFDRAGDGEIYGGIREKKMYGTERTQA